VFVLNQWPDGSGARVAGVSKHESAGPVPEPRVAPPPPPPEPGDFAPGFHLADQRGEPVLLRGDAVAGKPVMLVFVPISPGAAELDELRAFAAAGGEAQTLGAMLFAIRDATPEENARFAAAHALPFQILSDPGGRLRAVYGLAEGGLASALLTPNQRVALLLGREAPAAGQAGRLVAALREATEQIRPVTMAPHPPVLIVPDALSREECRDLIRLHDREGTPVKTGADYRGETGDFKIAINDYGRVDRVDYVIQDRALQKRIDGRIGRRVLPEVLKAFQYRVTKREKFHVARYEGLRGGFQHGHRDNPTPELAHRRFALSLNLNVDEYEGGTLRFPEYGDQRYKVATGAALVFSSSLFHEVMEVTSGVRYVLLSHFYGEDDRQVRSR
jgi:peroxiredoxin